MRLPLLAVVLLISGCEPPVTSTFVTGSVNGVSIVGASAVSAKDKNLLGFDRETVWISSGSVCTRLRSAVLPHADAFGASFVSTADGGRAPALILTSDGSASFDTGVGEERLRGTSKLTLRRTDSNGDTAARFTATFSSDAGTDSVSGDYVASHCETANPGCGAAPGVLILGALVLLRRRRSGLPLSPTLSPLGGEGDAVRRSIPS